MIPWCMRAANSAGATATGKIASLQYTRMHAHTHKLNWAKLKAKKDLQLEKAGLMPSQDELSCHTKKNTIWTLTPGPHPRCGPIQKEMI